MIITAENILLVGSILMFLSILAWKAGFRFGVPALLLFLGVGMLFGSDGLGIQFDNPGVAQTIGMIALCIILFSGGMDTKYTEIRPVLGPGIVLATVGVAITAVITGYFIYWATAYFNWPYPLSLAESMLLAAVMASTDSASVFSILRSKGIRLKQQLRPLLELESGSNDPMAYLMTIMLIQVIQMGDMNIGDMALLFLVQMSVGLVAGYLLGKLTVKVINRIDIENTALYAVLLLTLVFFIFAITTLLQGNGYLAVYLAGLVVGNHKIIHKKSIAVFFDGFTWMWQIVMFLALGLLVNPHELLPVVGLGLSVGIFMILVSRPASVFLSLLPFRKLTMRARVFVSWVGLRGAVPIIFATYPLIAGIENSKLIFNVVFFITILSLLLQGTTIPVVARMLKLSCDKPEEGSDFGVELPDAIKSVMTEINLTSGVLEKGNTLMALPLPENTLAVMVKRDGKFFIPNGRTKLEPDDKLLVISDKDEALLETYRNLGIEDFTIQRN